jgi:hypothetical protein
MSGTQKLSRYYTPETTRMIADLKEARERKQMVINDFQYKVRPPSSFVSGEFCAEAAGSLAALRRIRQALLDVDGRHQGRRSARLSLESLQELGSSRRAVRSAGDC